MSWSLRPTVAKRGNCLCPLAFLLVMAALPSGSRAAAVTVRFSADADPGYPADPADPNDKVYGVLTFDDSLFSAVAAADTYVSELRQEAPEATIQLTWDSYGANGQFLKSQTIATPPPEITYYPDLLFSAGSYQHSFNFYNLNGVGWSSPTMAFMTVPAPIHSINGVSDLYTAPPGTLKLQWISATNSIIRAYFGNLRFAPAGTGPVVADAGPDQSVEERELVTLDASASTGEGLFYRWRQLPGGPAAALSNPMIASPVFEAPLLPYGSESVAISFEVTVTNGTTSTSTDTVTVTVNSSPRPPVTVRFSADADPGYPADPADPNDEVYGVLTFDDSLFRAVAAADTYVFELRQEAPHATISLTWDSYDTNGLFLGSNTIATPPPEITYYPDLLFSAGSYQHSFNFYNLNGVGWPFTHAMAFMRIPAPIHSINDVSDFYTAPPGTLELQWIAETNTVVEAHFGNLRFVAAGTGPVVADAGPDQSVEERELVTLDASASTGEGLFYRWRQLPGGPAAALSNPTIASPTFEAPLLPCGSGSVAISFEVTVTNGTTSTSADTVTVTVNSSSRTPRPHTFAFTARADPNLYVNGDPNAANALDTIDGTFTVDEAVFEAISSGPGALVYVDQQAPCATVELSWHRTDASGNLIDTEVVSTDLAITPMPDLRATGATTSSSLLFSKLTGWLDETRFAIRFAVPRQSLNAPSALPGVPVDSVTLGWSASGRNVVAFFRDLVITTGSCPDGDTDPPLMTCPADITTQCAGDSSALVSLSGASASDSCGSVTVSGPAATASYPLGVTTVTYTATDGGGHSSSCTTQVTVVDTVPPTLTCPPSAQAECTASGMASVSIAAVTGADACGATSVSGPSGTATYPLGVTTLTFVAQDASANRAQCASEVSVVDTTPPTIACPAPVVAECAGNGSANVSVRAAAASDACTPPIVTGPAGVAAYPLGTTAVAFAAQDQSANTASCATTVSVVDSTPPELACPPDVIAECTGAGEASVDPGRAVAADVCGPVALSEPGPAGYPLGATAVTHVATDGSGNTSSCINGITVIDTEPPVFEPATVGEQAVVGGCSPTQLEFVVPSAVDACRGVAVSCAPLAANSFGANRVTCVAEDETGNTATAEITVHVLEPLRIAFRAPLGDDNVPGSIDTDADVANFFRSSQVVVHKVRLYDCASTDVTTLAPVTVGLSVHPTAAEGEPDSVNEVSESTVRGDAGSLMTLTDGAFQYNLKTNTADFPPGGKMFRSIVTVTYTASPLTGVGMEDAILVSK
jgi:hypothetical protein